MVGELRKVVWVKKKVRDELKVLAAMKGITSGELIEELLKLHD